MAEQSSDEAGDLAELERLEPAWADFVRSRYSDSWQEINAVSQKSFASDLAPSWNLVPVGDKVVPAPPPTAGPLRWSLRKVAEQLAGYKRRLYGARCTAQLEKWCKHSVSGSSLPSTKPPQLNGPAVDVGNPHSLTRAVAQAATQQDALPDDRDPVALVEALLYVAQCRVPMPDWLATEVITRLNRTLALPGELVLCADRRPVSLHDAFDLGEALPQTPAKGIAARRKRREVEVAAALGAVRGKNSRDRKALHKAVKLLQLGEPGLRHAVVKHKIK